MTDMVPEGFGVRIGETVAGRYRIDGLLGQGGFGAVFRATQLNLGRIVALKILHAHLVASPESLARFEREALLAQQLGHPNTVRLYDFGHTEAGVPWIAWEHLDGLPLDAVIRSEGSLSPARVARIARQVLASLQEAHGQGIVHRDIKPSNLFLCRFAGETDFVKVLDFGIAKSAAPAGQAPMTQAGMAVGTPSYMAPEQVMAGAVGPGTDLYALGLVMAEALTGGTVFTGQTPMAVFMKHASDEPVPLAPHVYQSSLGAVIARAVEKAPERRYGDAMQMHSAIAAIEVGLPQVAARASLPLASGVLPMAGTSGQMALADPTLHPVRPTPAKRGLLLPISIGLGVVAVLLGTAALGVALSEQPRSTTSRAPDDDDDGAQERGYGQDLPEVDFEDGPKEKRSRAAKETCHEDRKFHGASLKTLEKRIRKAGFSIQQRTPGRTATWLLARGDVSVGVVQYFRTDSFSASITFQLCEDEDEVWARDKTSLLMVDFSDEPRLAEKLLIAMTKKR